MKTFLILTKSEINDYIRDIFYIEEEFSLSASVFSILWTIYNKLWKITSIFSVLYLMFYYLFTINIINFNTLIITFFTIAIYIGSKAQDWYIKKLISEGYIFQDIITAKNLEEAQQIFINSSIDRPIK